MHLTETQEYFKEDCESDIVQYELYISDKNRMGYNDDEQEDMNLHFLYKHTD